MLNNTAKSFSKDTLIYGLGGALKKTSSFLLLPFLTQNISTIEYGIFGLIAIITISFSGFSNLGTANSLTIFFFEESNPKNREKLIWTNFILLFLCNILLLFVIIFLSKFISNLMFQTDKYSSLIIISVLGLSFQSMCDPFMNYLRMIKRPIDYVKINLMGSILFFLITIYLVVFRELGLIGYIISIAISQFILLLFSIIIIGRKLSFGFHFINAFNLIKIGFPSIFGLFAFLVIDLSDRKIIEIFLNLEQLGIYTVAYSFGMIAILITDAFSSTWTPFFSSFIKKQKAANEIFPSILEFYILLILVVSLMFFCFSKPLIYFMTDKSYHAGYKVVGLIAFSYLIKGVYHIFLPGIYFKKKLYLMSLIEWTSAIFNILLNFLLIPLMGIVGAAIATTLSYLTLCFITYHCSKGYLFIKYRWKNIFSNLFLAMLSISIMTFLNNAEFTNLYKEMIFNTIILIVTLYFMFKMNKKYFSNFKNIIN